MDKVTLFSTDIWKVNVKEWKNVKNEILDLIPDYSEKYSSNITAPPPPFPKDYEPFYTDFFDDDGEELSEYRNKFLDLVSPYIKQFSKLTPQKKIKTIINVWCQKYGKLSHHSIHDHGSVGYSAIFYASVDESKESGTFFISPHFDEYGGRPQLTIQPAEGDLVFFPSYLLHSSPLNESGKERIIISFNMGV
jgi:hypothetical protein|tara:strand:+ start:177 stop:752 length:576 start_codon:yes stop_codon:yes gene_type:complete